MSDPHVTAILLTADRPELTLRAVKSFMAQTYEHKSLLIFDSGLRGLSELRLNPDNVYVRADQFRGSTIGALRNAANELAGGTDIIAHWDSDDLSHSHRLAEQVDLLQSSRADAVGYNEMLFYNSEAYVYRTQPFDPRFALGTSLTYWRKAWERLKFEDTSEGEDTRWVRRVRLIAESSMKSEPRMIAGIHGGNTVATPHRVKEWTSGGNKNFTRAPQWDAYCKSRMELK